MASAVDRLQRAGFKSWEDAPWSFKQRLANDSHLGYLVTGSFALEGRRVRRHALAPRRVDRPARRREDAPGKRHLRSRRRDVGRVEKGSQRPRRPDRDVEGPSGRGDHDLVASKALEDIALGIEEGTAIDHDWAGSIDLFEKAVAADSTAAIAYFSLLQLYIDSNRGEKTRLGDPAPHAPSVQAPRADAVHGEVRVLPSPQGAGQGVRGAPDGDRALPRGHHAPGRRSPRISPRETASTRRSSSTRRFSRSIPIARSFCRRSVGSTERKGISPRRSSYFEEYAKRIPTNVSSFTEHRGHGLRGLGRIRSGDAELRKGPPSRARRRVGAHGGRRDRGEAGARRRRPSQSTPRPLRLARTPDDRIEIYAGLQDLYVDRGAARKIVRADASQVGGVQEVVYSPVQADDQPNSRTRGSLVKAKRADEGVRDHRVRSPRGTGPRTMVSCPLGYMYVYLELEQADSAEVLLSQRLMPFIDAYQSRDSFAETSTSPRGGSRRSAGTTESDREFRKQSAVNPTDASVHYLHRTLPEKARRLREAPKPRSRRRSRSIPNDPDVLYELALLQSDKGEKDESDRRRSTRRLEVWKDADPVFKPAREARETRARWTSVADRPLRRSLLSYIEAKHATAKRAAALFFSQTILTIRTSKEDTMKIAVSTPTGNIGRALTGHLLDAGAEVVLLVRNADKVKDFAERGAKVQVGNLEDADFVARATKGVDVLFWLTPPNMATDDFRGQQNQLGDVAIRAIRQEHDPARRKPLERRRAARERDGTHRRAPRHREEARPVGRACDASSPHFLHGEPVHDGRDDGEETAPCTFPFAGSARMEMIATRDIAKAAAERILDARGRAAR